MDDNLPIPASVLDEIERLEKAATPGPWADGGGSFSDFGREWPGSLSMEFISNGGAEDDDIAAHAPDRKEADAALIVAMRNALPEIIRLARIGMKAEGSGAVDVPDIKLAIADYLEVRDEAVGIVTTDEERSATAIDLHDIALRVFHSISTDPAPSYKQIIALVENCRERRAKSGESDRMMARRISEGLRALLPALPETGDPS